MRLSCTRTCTQAHTHAQTHRTHVLIPRTDLASWTFRASAPLFLPVSVEFRFPTGCGRTLVHPARVHVYACDAQGIFDKSRKVENISHDAHNLLLVTLVTKKNREAVTGMMLITI